ncbi:MAG: MmgE/PrpD family protein [Alphaproteobacteria bacterium]|nr:MmgE/PrpD family protein [Alphaproteobacteria bacterium]
MNAVTKQPDSVETISRFASALRFQDIPFDIVAVAKHTVLDTLGVALASSGIGEGCAEVIEFVTAQGGAPEATIWSTGQRVPAASAAMANGTLARALDYDDILESPQTHVAVCVVPAAFAAAERRARPVSGQELIAALVVGCEIQHRLALAIAKGQDPHEFPALIPTQVFGYFSAAAAAGRLFGLTPAKMQSALGLALMQTAGTEELVVHSADSMGKTIYAAFCNQAGVQSAVLAEHGVLAHGAVFDGKAGLFGAHYDGRYDRRPLTEGLGETFVSGNRCFKFWPGTLVTHPFIEAALALIAAHDIAPADIEQVTARVGVWGRAMSEPLAMRRKPPTSSAAMNSLPFILAKVLVNRTVTLADFKGTRRSETAALAMAERISSVFDPALSPTTGPEGGALEIRRRDGRVHAMTVDRPRGHPSRPLSFDEIATKFRSNAGYAKVVPAAGRLDRIIDLVRRLDELADVREIVASLVS